jgi:hypothetical protein
MLYSYNGIRPETEYTKLVGGSYAVAFIATWSSLKQSGFAVPAPLFLRAGIVQSV